MSGKRKDRERRHRLWLRNPHCHWCGVLTVEPPPGEKRKHRPDNEASLDHLRPRGDPARTVPNLARERRLVLACIRCNNERDRAQWSKEKRREMTERGKPHRTITERVHVQPS